jgi:hypothetical protein
MSIETPSPRGPRCLAPLKSLFLSAGLLLGLAVGLGHAGDPIDPGGGGGSAPGGGGGGDAVGSLPVRKGGFRSGSEGEPGSSVYENQRPHLVLSGTRAELRRVLVSLSDRSAARWEPAAQRGEWRLILEGRVSVDLDRGTLQQGFVKGQIEYGDLFVLATSVVQVGTRVQAIQALGREPVRLRLRQLAGTGLVDEGLLWTAFDPDGGSARLAIQAHGNVIRIAQH